MRPLIIHVGQFEITEETGMGRVAWHWKREFEKRGYDFIHIGDAQVGSLPHIALFPYAAYKAYKRINRSAALILVHEPASGIFAGRANPTVVFSHGIERRGWKLALLGQDGASTRLRLRTRLLFPLWRLRQCDLGLSKAVRLLLINREDAAFAEKHYRRDSSHIYVFKNGVYPTKLNEECQPSYPTVLFLGSWLERKGIRTLIEAATILDEKGLRLKWLLAGISADHKTVLGLWPKSLHTSVEVIPHFKRDSEEGLFARASCFVLPSFFEGQPLALLQAMESGRCCITTNCCGQRDLIEHGFNGLLHEPGDAKHLASLIEKCIEDKGLRTRLGRNAKHTVKDRKWDVVSSELIDLIEKTLRSCGNAEASQIQ